MIGKTCYEFKERYTSLADGNGVSLSRHYDRPGYLLVITRNNGFIRRWREHYDDLAEAETNFNEIVAGAKRLAEAAQ